MLHGGLAPRDIVRMENSPPVASRRLHTITVHRVCDPLDTTTMETDGVASIGSYPLSAPISLTRPH